MTVNDVVKVFPDSSLPDEAFRRNVEEFVFGLLVFVNKMSSFSPTNTIL